MIPQLESMIKQKMTPTLVDRVDFSTEGEIFVDLVAHTLKVSEYSQFVWFGGYVGWCRVGGSFSLV